MALTLLQRKKIQQGLIPVLLVVVFITTAVLWLGFFKAEPVVPGESQGVVAPEIRSVEVNFDVLSLPLLQELNSPVEPVLEPDTKGRSNPFLPFF